MKNLFKSLAFALALIAPVPAVAQPNPNAVVTVANVAAITGRNLLGTPYIQLQGYYAANDGGAGGLLTYVSTDTTSAHNGVTIFVDSAGHRYYRAKNTPISVLEGGAKCDGTTDDTARIQATINYTSSFNSTNAVVTFPLTVCKTIADLQGVSNLTLRGPGKGKGGIFQAETSPSPPSAGGATIYGNALSNIVIDGLRIQGNWLAIQNDTGNRCTYFTNAYNITIQNSECAYSRGIGFSVNIGYSISFINNYVHHNARDNISCEDCQSGVATGNTIIHGGDDAIAWHVAPSTNAPVRGLVNISNNIVMDTFGIKALGLKSGQVSNNTCQLTKGYCVYLSYVQGAFSEGLNSQTGVNVTGNVSTDIVNPVIYDGSNNINNCIVIGSFAQGGTSPTRPVPWFTTGSGVYAPWPWTWNAGPGTSPISPGFALKVDGNNCTRTLPDGVSYASYGFNPTQEVTNVGYMFTASGWVNPTVTAGALNGTGVIIRGYLRETSISNNTFGSGSYGIFFTADGTDPLTVDSTVIRGNTIFNASNNGIGTDLTAALKMNMVIEDNWIDCDPLQLVASHNANGTWTNTAFPGGVDMVRVQGATVGGNHIRNCLFAVRTDGDSIIAKSKPNILYLNPVALGWNASNAGIGNVPRGEHYVIINANPSSANFNEIVNDNYTEADLSGGCPATGTWVEGVFVTNTAQTVSGGKVLIGCARLTTGAANDPGTDWTPVYGTNS